MVGGKGELKLIKCYESDLDVTETGGIGSDATIPFTNGALYFCVNSGNIYSDTQYADGDQRRIRFATNAEFAEAVGDANAASSRNNLNVYSKEETNTAVDAAKTFTKNKTIATNLWASSNGGYTATLAADSDFVGITNPPIILGTDDDNTEYSKIDDATLNENTGVLTFTASKLPATAINLAIVIVK